MTGAAGSAEYLRNLLVGHIPVQLACAMAGLRLADLLLADGPMTVERLSAAARRGLARLLPALARSGRHRAGDARRERPGCRRPRWALLRSGATRVDAGPRPPRGPNPIPPPGASLEHTVRTATRPSRPPSVRRSSATCATTPEDGAAFDGG